MVSELVNQKVKIGSADLDKLNMTFFYIKINTLNVTFAIYLIT